MGIASQKAQRERREADMPERIRELAEMDIQNFPRKYGDLTHIVQIQSIATGKVDRWLIRRGDRTDRITWEKVGLWKRSASCGAKVFMDHLRGYLCGRKA